MNAFDELCAYNSHCIDGSLVDNMWHKIFPGGTATIEFALSLQLGDKRGVIMPTERREHLVFDIQGMAYDLMQPMRNMDAIREEFYFNGKNIETDDVLSHLGAIYGRSYGKEQMEQCKILTEVTNVSDAGSSQPLPDIDVVREDFNCNGINDVVYDCVLSQDEDKYDRRHEEKQKKPRRPLKNVAIINGASFTPNSRTSNQKRSARERRSSEAEYCVFCYNNGTTPQNYKSHLCRDELGLVSCPILQKMVCPFCKATGLHAHTPKYCPHKPIITPEDCEAIQQHHLRKVQGRRRSSAGNPTGKENASAEASELKHIFKLKTYMHKHSNISEHHYRKPESHVSVRM